MYLLDTNIVSELRRVRPHPAIAAWLSAAPANQLFVSAVTVGELQAGVEMTRRQDAAKADSIEAWIDATIAAYNIIPVDAAIFRQWARLMHRRSRDVLEDALIAATAVVHGLTVVTRNTRDFERLGLAPLDPSRASTA